MAIQCPNCATQNPDQSAFCVRCGQNLSQQNYGPSTYRPTGAFPPPFSQPISAPGAFPPPLSQPISMQSTAIAASPPAAIPMGGAQGDISLRRAFAGHGTPIMHYSWLLDGKQVQAATLTTVIVQRLLQRGIAGLAVTQEKLTERGVLMETRDYIKAIRGVSTVFMYVAPAGHDLYISRTNTVRPAINNIRVIIFLLLAFIALFGPLIIGGIIANMVSSSAASSGNVIGTLYATTAASTIGGIVSACVSFPIYLFLIVVLARAIINWIFEKDFWMFLRSNALNDFQIDDIALIAHVSDEVIHDAVKELGLDASKIKPPMEGYQPKRQIRAF